MFLVTVLIGINVQKELHHVFCNVNNLDQNIGNCQTTDRWRVDHDRCVRIRSWKILHEVVWTRRSNCKELYCSLQLKPNSRNSNGRPGLGLTSSGLFIL